MLPLWFLACLFGLIITLSGGPVSTPDAILGMTATLLPLAAFVSLFLADVMTLVVNLLFLAYNAAWSAHGVVTWLFLRNKINAGILSGPFSAVGDLTTATTAIEAAFSALYISCMVMFLRHTKFFVLKP